MKNSREFIQLRNQALLRYIETKGSVTVDELVIHFQLSPATVRRTLANLEQDQMLLRTHGGAKSLQTVEHLSLEIKTNVNNIAAKNRVAQIACKEIRDGDVIALGCGSTTLFLAKLLHGRKDLTVITDSVYVAVELLGEEGIGVYLSGGFVYSTCGAVFSSAPSELFQTSNVNKAFVGVDGISISTSSVSAMAHLTSVERAVLNSGEKVYVLADHSKFEKKAVIERLASFEELDYLVTDIRPSQEAMEALIASNVTVLY